MRTSFFIFSTVLWFQSQFIVWRGFSNFSLRIVSFSEKGNVRSLVNLISKEVNKSQTFHYLRGKKVSSNLKKVSVKTIGGDLFVEFKKKADWNCNFLQHHFLLTKPLRSHSFCPFLKKSFVIFLINFYFTILTFGQNCSASRVWRLGICVQLTPHLS